MAKELAARYATSELVLHGEAFLDVGPAGGTGKCCPVATRPLGRLDGAVGVCEQLGP